MKKYLWVNALIFCLVSSLSAAKPFDLKLTPYTIECLDKNEIEPQEKSIIEKTSWNIVSMVKSQQANQLWEISCTSSNLI